MAAVLMDAWAYVSEALVTVNFWDQRSWAISCLAEEKVAGETRNAFLNCNLGVENWQLEVNRKSAGALLHRGKT
jgi:hypothetical protein